MSLPLYKFHALVLTVVEDYIPGVPFASRQAVPAVADDSAVAAHGVEGFEEIRIPPQIIRARLEEPCHIAADVGMCDQILHGSWPNVLGLESFTSRRSKDAHVYFCPLCLHPFPKQARIRETPDNA